MTSHEHSLPKRNNERIQLIQELCAYNKNPRHRTLRTQDPALNKIIESDATISQFLNYTNEEIKRLTQQYPTLIRTTLGFLINRTLLMAKMPIDDLEIGIEEKTQEVIQEIQKLAPEVFPSKEQEHIIELIASIRSLYIVLGIEFESLEDIYSQIFDTSKASELLEDVEGVLQKGPVQIKNNMVQDFLNITNPTNAQETVMHLLLLNSSLESQKTKIQSEIKDLLNSELSLQEIIETLVTGISHLQEEEDAPEQERPRTLADLEITVMSAASNAQWDILIPLIEESLSGENEADAPELKEAYHKFEHITQTLARSFQEQECLLCKSEEMLEFFKSQRSQYPQTPSVGVEFAYLIEMQEYAPIFKYLGDNEQWEDILTHAKNPQKGYLFRAVAIAFLDYYLHKIPTNFQREISQNMTQIIRELSQKQTEEEVNTYTIQKTMEIAIKLAENPMIAF